MKRRLKLSILHAARALGLFSLSRALTSRGVRILCYHGIWLGKEGWPGDAMFMRRETFAQRLVALKALGYSVIPLSTAVKGLKGETEIPPSSVVVTIDDGWFSTYDSMVPALVKHGMPATLYCDTAHLLGGLPIAHVMARYCRMLAGRAELAPEIEALYKSATDVSSPMPDRLAATRDFCRSIGVDADAYVAHRVFGYMTAEELRETSRSGVEIELHTHNHTLGDMTQPRVTSEIDANRIELAKLLDREPASFSHFCYPSGVTSGSAAAALGAIGIESSTTTENRIAFASDTVQLLPRFLDGEQVSAIEFEAEISGFSHMLRILVERVSGTLRPKPAIGALNPSR